jgi:hypothetical protein
MEHDDPIEAKGDAGGGGAICASQQAGRTSSSSSSSIGIADILMEEHARALE